MGPYFSTQLQTYKHKQCGTRSLVIGRQNTIDLGRCFSNESIALHVLTQFNIFELYNMRLVCRAWHRHCMKLVVEHSFDYCVAPIEHTALEVTTRSYWRSTSWEPTHGGPFYAAYTALFPLINIFGKACYSNANAVLLYDAAWLLRRHMFSRQEYCWEATDTPAVLESSNATQTQIQPKEEAEGSMLSLNMIIISLKLEVGIPGIRNCTFRKLFLITNSGTYVHHIHTCNTTMKTHLFMHLPRQADIIFLH